MTDVIGELVSIDAGAVVVRGRDGTLVQVAAERIVALKPLGPKPIRTSEIRSLEAAAADGLPGVDREWIDGWQLRFGHGFTGRANSAVPLEPGASTAPETLARITARYAACGLTPTLALPDRLGTPPAGWSTYNESAVMAADISKLVLRDGDSATAVTAEPTAEWLDRLYYQGRAAPAGAAEVVSAVRGGTLGFGMIGARSSSAAAVGRAAVTTAPDGRCWVGLTSLWVSPEHRRNGLGTLMCGELVRWGREHGATHAYLQVAVENTRAVALYRDLGFEDHHRYRYARPESATGPNPVGGVR
ncbi:GNAT family N-acetyltransferase [Rhodococcus sp. IEGM 1401]|uniref:N-acetylglutamate synthase, CG3035 family n=1 Tax=unclassified Rhodococcus (in: high G+C Gram-positive bacteria) TaxID=192944 RepID=UPI0022B43D41|nr:MULTISPECIES: GNAT family N-acetyltransferase [unclassified Rhodococcus (in: high G+C Gram-positive bacteria)]MCZ4561561.1 GNAT family N-acetyltransferase [Rhodococcus sp. IEGM 1401]MDI9921819.1 GNAT family N-acetyltransferase [Rhodococcus sp. IEGM 1372]MDV8034156.1 GNAT family N-acetyltransferase [Rhodococcus sp. IEGM 1414]